MLTGLQYIYNVRYSQLNELLKQFNKSPDSDSIGDEGVGEVGGCEDDDGAEVCEGRVTGNLDDEDGRVGEGAVLHVDGGNVVDEVGGDGDEGCECAGKDEEDDIELASVTLKCCGVF